MKAGVRRAFAHLMAVAVFLFLGLTGCGKQSPQALLDKALNRVSQKATVQAQLQVEMEPLAGSKSIPLRVEGKAGLDFAGDSMRAELGTMGFSATLLYIRGKVYIGLGGQWYILPESGEGEDISRLAAGAGELLLNFPELLRCYSSVESLGREKVAGFSCEHLALLPDLEAVADSPLLRGLTREAGLSQQEVLAYLKEADINVELWVEDKQDLVRKVFLSGSVDLGDLGIKGKALALEGRSLIKLYAVLTAYDAELDFAAPEGARPFDPSVLPF